MTNESREKNYVQQSLKKGQKKKCMKNIHRLQRRKASEKNRKNQSHLQLLVRFYTVALYGYKRKKIRKGSTGLILFVQKLQLF